ncbi:MAG: RHS repeat protein [Holophagales bacterium]|nr:MAG: RHS repeat protein [Holophagales bacterium]
MRSLRPQQALVQTTRFEIDALNRVTRIVDPPAAGTSRRFTYDAIGNVVEEVDRRGIATRTSVDRENRPTARTRAGLELERVEYDEAGNRLFVTDANGNTTGFLWDERNLLLQENRPLAAITRHVLDDVGDRVETVDPEGHRSHFAYDLRRRQTSATNGAGERTSFCYDGVGNRTGMRRPKSAASGDPCVPGPGGWSYRYDGAHRLSGVTDPLGHETTYGYDGNGNRTVQRDANGHTTSFVYDALDRLASKTYPDAAVETYGYDPNGNRTTLVDAKGQPFAFTYDALDRLTTETLPNPSPPTGDELTSRVTTHDANGNVTSVAEQYSSSGAALVTTSYDDFDRPLATTNRYGETTTLTYDANGNRRSVRDSDGQVTSYAYDALNRLVSQTGAGGVTTSEYFKSSLLKTRTYPNGASATHGYDAANRLTRLDNRQNSALVASWAYAYDANGNRTEQVETNGGAPETTSYTYDAADRLIEVAYPEKTVSTTLDPVGNRLTEVTTDASHTTTSAKTYAYDIRDRLLSTVDSVAPANNATFTWDANGNQTGKSEGGVQHGFLFDALDRLIEVQRNGLLLERYTFDPSGYRIRKAGPDGIFRYVRDDGAILQQTDDAGTTLVRYEWGGDRLVAMHPATGQRSFSLFDGLGSLTAWSQTDGSLSLRRSFDAWGNLRHSTGTTLAPFAFTGHELDAATGLTYAKARFLDTEVGRFLSEDPILGEANTPPSLHRYLYAYGNPTFYTDPLGLYSWNEFKQDVAFAVDVYVETQKGMWDPRNAGKNAQRALGGAIGAGKFVGETVASGASLALDTGLVAAVVPGARQRNVDRLKALENFVSHPVQTVVSAHEQAIARIEEHEAKGEYIKSGIVGGELGASDAAAVIGGAEAGVAVARGAARLATRALSVDFAGVEVGLGEGAVGAVEDLAPKFEPPVGASQAVRVRGVGIGESATGAVEVAEVQVTRGVSAEVSAGVGGAAPVRAGQFGESVGTRVSGLPKNTRRIPSASGKREYRIPDHMDEAERFIQEDKAVGSQYLSSQLLDYKAHVLRAGGAGRVQILIDETAEITRSLLREHLNPGSPIKLKADKLRSPRK